MFIAAGVLGACSAVPVADGVHKANSARELGVQASLAGLPLYFIENRGQMDRRVAYSLGGSDTSVHFHSDGLTFSLGDEADPRRRWTLKLDFLGAEPGVKPRGLRRTPAAVSYFSGAPRNWKTARTYARVAYEELWPGIDLVFSGTQQRLKYSFLVEPGADPEDIRLAWRGAGGLEVNARGQLEVSTPARTLLDARPSSHQIIRGRRVPVATSYALHSERTYGFRVGAHDRSRPLLIDPAVLVYAGFIGGRADEFGNNVAVGPAGHLYVTGSTSSSQETFPDKVGPDRTFNRLPDAFVAKINPAGTGLVYAGYIGGSDGEAGIGIAVDRAGRAHISGSTGSREDTFPVRIGPDLTYNGGARDAFVARVNRSGTRLEYAGYIGGAAPTPPGTPNEQANGIALDRAGNAYVAGFTPSPAAAGFPVTPGAFDTTHNGAVDAFVAKVAPSGRALVYAGYIGGAGADPATGISVDSSGNAYVNGFTGSDETTFPDGDGLGPLRGPDLTYNGGPLPFPAPNDVFVAKVSSSGANLTYAGYVGGSGVEQPFGNAVDGAGNLYVTGNTTSTQGTFPDGNGFGSVTGADRSYNGGSGDPSGGDVFVVKVNPSGSGLANATYLGGSGDERAVGIDLDGGGNAYLSGETSSRATSFPVKEGPDRTYNGGSKDALVAKLNPSLTDLVFAGYVGGSDTDTGIGVAVDRAGSIYISGSTDSSQASFPVSKGPSRRHGGLSDVFVAKLSTLGCLGRAVTHVGTPGRDRVAGSRGADAIATLGGNDAVGGGGGADRICGGAGADRLRAGAGDDRVAGGLGADFLEGGPGRDRLDGGGGRDTCAGGPGRDRFAGCEIRRAAR